MRLTQRKEVQRRIAFSNGRYDWRLGHGLFRWRRNPSLQVAPRFQRSFFARGRVRAGKPGKRRLRLRNVPLMPGLLRSQQSLLILLSCSHGIPLLLGLLPQAA